MDSAQGIGTVRGLLVCSVVATFVIRLLLKAARRSTLPLRGLQAIFGLSNVLNRVKKLLLSLGRKCVLITVRVLLGTMPSPHFVDSTAGPVARCTAVLTTCVVGLSRLTMVLGLDGLNGIFVVL